MKSSTLIALASSITATAFAGSAKETIIPAPEPAPAAPGGWFIGATYGQLNSVGIGGSDFFDQVVENEIERPLYGNEGTEVDDFDFDLFSLHVGRDLETKVLGCDVAAYLEVAYLTGDATLTAYLYNSGGAVASTGVSSTDIDLDIIPITLNVKLERGIFGALSVYGTAGVGYAFSDASVLGESERDGGFYAQASAGLLYNVTQQFEIYGGARWLYLGSVGIADDDDLQLDNDFAWEVGLRYNF